MRQHLGLAEHRHQHGEDRQLVVAQRARRDRDGIVALGRAAAADRDENALEHEIAEIEHAHRDVERDQRGDRREREAEPADASAAR